VTAVEDPHNARGRRTRAALLAATHALIESGGWEAVTMSAVADRAGVTRRAVYLHFAGRAELLTALFGYVNETLDLASSLRPVLTAPDAATAVTEWAWHLARYHPPLIRIGRALQQARHTDPAAAAHWDLVMRDWRSLCRRLAAGLDQAGRLAPPWTVETATDMLWALMSFDVLEGLLVERHWSRRRLGEHLAALACATFVSPPP
jgi:AcrR family transcriptional regulator